jgi:tetrahydrodipicolinate N-acetyltransferase
VYPTGAGTTILVGEWHDVKGILEHYSKLIRYYHLENDRRNSAIPLLDLKKINARIEPGAVIREKVEIGDRAIIMMGAVINIGAVVGAGTMIDMNAVVGARALVGANCHIGAGAVLAGVLEPPSADPVVIEDDVLVGANAVVLEGCRVGKGSVVAAGAVVVNNIEPGVVVAGQPARVIKKVDEKTKDKTALLKELRKLNED